MWPAALNEFDAPVIDYMYTESALNYIDWKVLIMLLLFALLVLSNINSSLL